MWRCIQKAARKLQALFFHELFDGLCRFVESALNPVGMEVVIEHGAAAGDRVFSVLGIHSKAELDATQWLVNVAFECAIREVSRETDHPCSVVEPTMRRWQGDHFTQSFEVRKNTCLKAFPSEQRWEGPPRLRSLGAGAFTTSLEGLDSVSETASSHRKSSRIEWGSLTYA
jgi:hypothetical protein